MPRPKSGGTGTEVLKVSLELRSETRSVVVKFQWWRTFEVAGPVIMEVDLREFEY